MQNFSELERFASLMALSANVMRKIADCEMGEDRTSLSSLADNLDELTARLVELIFPETAGDV